MRVLLIANTLPPRDVSGVGEQVLQLAEGLKRAGHEPRVLGRGPGGARGPKVLFPLAIVPAALVVAWRWRPAVIQVHESDGALAILALCLIRPWLRPRPRLIALLQVSYRRERAAVRPLQDHSGGEPRGQILGSPGKVERRFRRFKAPVQILLGRLTAGFAELVLAPSAVTAAELKADYGVERVEVLPNVSGGLERNPEAPPADETAQAPDDLSGALLFVGRLRIRKGVEVLLHALARLRGRFESPPLLVIAGDGEHGEALRALAAELGFTKGAQEEETGTEPRVVFLGRCAGPRVAALLEQARALVVPSIYEGMPLVILEAMSAGVPVVASAVSGIPEVVVDGETGWLVPPEDVTALVTALEEVLEDRSEAQRRGQAGLRRRLERYHVDEVAQRWLEVVQPLLER